MDELIDWMFINEFIDEKIMNELIDWIFNLMFALIK